MKKAFSLIELLISLIIISLVISAFTPIITKKLKYQNAVYSAAQKMKNSCSDFDTAEGACLLCNEKECNLCTSSINIPDGYFINPAQSCDKKSCREFDSKCKRCTKDGCQECEIGYRINSSKTCELATCNRGFYLSGSSCNSCNPGTFQANDNSTATSCSTCASKTPNCTSCDTQDGTCSVCQDGFNLTDGSCIALFNSKTFYYTGGVQTWTVPFDGTFKFEVWGAQGGASYNGAGGGYGGYAQGTKSLNAGQTIYIYVGGMGATPAAGYNGGGPGYSNCGGGGGASDIRIGGTAVGFRVIVAGGGGGGGKGYVDRYATGGTGGGANGGAGTNSCTYCEDSGVGKGATQSGGAALAQGGDGNNLHGGGGGGGYYGGYGAGTYNGGAGGGGGSGFIGGVSSGSMSNGAHAGNGEVKITKI